MSKKSVFWIGLLATSMFLIMFILVQINGCKEDLFFFCRDSYTWIIHTLRPFLVLFFFSLITYKMRDEIFRTWIKFAYIWVPLTLILTFLAPEYGNELLPIEKSTVSFWMSVFFLIISLIIIISKHLSLKKKAY